MKCERCGQASQGASWYCSRCGAPLSDLNVADSGSRRPIPALLKLALAVTGVSLSIVVCVALATVGVRGARTLVDGGWSFGRDADSGTVALTNDGESQAAGQGGRDSQSGQTGQGSQTGRGSQTGQAPANAVRGEGFSGAAGSAEAGAGSGSGSGSGDGNAGEIDAGAAGPATGGPADGAATAGGTSGGDDGGEGYGESDGDDSGEGDAGASATGGRSGGAGGGEGSATNAGTDGTSAAGSGGGSGVGSAAGTAAGSAAGTGGTNLDDSAESSSGQSSLELEADGDGSGDGSGDGAAGAADSRAPGAGTPDRLASEPNEGSGGRPTGALARATAAALSRSRAALSPSATAIPLVRGGAPIWRSPRLAEPPVLDGELDDWTGEPITIESVVFGSEFWDGPDDLSATAFSGWDDETLYMAVQVVDEYFSQPSRGRQLHLSDSLELQIDADLSGDLTSAKYSDDDWQIGVAPGDFEGQPPEAYVWRPLAESSDAVLTGSQRLDNGYIVEFALPWEMIAFDPAVTRSLGVALNVSDNDDPRPAQLTMISYAPARSWADPRTFATLVLVE